MAEQIFKSPGFFEREIDLSQTQTSVSGVPAGIVGTAQMGPAFVPVTVGSFVDFENRFGSLDPDLFGPYAVKEFLNNRTAVTYVRVLGAGANVKDSDISTTLVAGTVRGAGFAIEGTYVGPDSDKAGAGRMNGSLTFLVARHYVSASESVGYPVLTDNDSTPLTVNTVNLVRGMLMPASGTRFNILCYASATYSPDPLANNDVARPSSDGLFKLVISSSAGASFGATDGFPGVRVVTASLNPAHPAYIANVLNTDPEQFQKEQHLLYADFAVESEIARVDRGSAARLDALSGSVALVSGSGAAGSSDSGLGTSQKFQTAFGRFDTRYKTPTTTMFISQMFGVDEYDLFRVETISDGAVANTKFKISISNIKKSADPGADPYGTFTLEVRDFSDTDENPNVLERYGDCSLNPQSENYICRQVGDFHAYYNFDSSITAEQKVIVTGKYANRSSRIRIKPSGPLEEGLVPPSALPFGFRGLPSLKTNDTMTDGGAAMKGIAAASQTPRRLTITTNPGFLLQSVAVKNSAESLAIAPLTPGNMTGSILPPVPLRFKCTRGAVKTSAGFLGEPGSLEEADARFYWGVKFERLPVSSSNPGGAIGNAIYQSNLDGGPNRLITAYSKFLGIAKLDMFTTGSGADKFNNNKFTLSRVALYNSTGSATSVTDAVLAQVTGSVSDHMLQAAYIRDGVIDPSMYTVADDVRSPNFRRLTFGSLAALTSSVPFNRFSDFTKFTNMMYGGFDGLNILDFNMANMDDKASSADPGGMATGLALDIGLKSTANVFGKAPENSIVHSYKTAAKILTSDVSSRVNIVVIPGIRDSALTNYVLERLKTFGRAFYIMDIPSYDSSGVRLYADSENAPHVEKTANKLAGRSVNNNYAATYFPDVTIFDSINNRPVNVPSSIAALGALGYSDSVSYPWFAPAGFNRGSLGFVSNIGVRLNQADRDYLYENKINPIASFPTAGFVIFGQKTLQIARSSLDRVNVRRMLLEVKRIVSDVATSLVFEQNTPQTRARFVAEVVPLLSNVQAQQGIDQFRVVMDSSNNTEDDIVNNILNGRIVMVPTRAVEFIAIDFIITNAGVDFV